ncbi:MAG: hypothetical protein MJ189_05135, partial [Coriobacteriales bacterium]|nr:hypothetical protein [Coriobacteriales bacterium]
ELNKRKEANQDIGPITRQINVCKYLKEYASENDMNFDFIVIPTSMFWSNFSKDDLGKTLINFGHGQTPKMLKNVCKLLSVKEREHKDFYYLFYRPITKTQRNIHKIKVSEFCLGLIKSFQKIEA